MPSYRRSSAARPGWIALVALHFATNLGADSEPSEYFRITVVDSATGRGVPLVELRTVNEVVKVTDSAGRVAFREPGLMDTRVYFHVSSHGYEIPPDGFGYRGFRCIPTAGGEFRFEIRRRNIAERLYRVTGEGIYADSILLGDSAPIRTPLRNGLVLGQDSVVNAVYRGSLYWFWGDTNRADYPLGNFSTSGATSELPRRGGLDPSVGVDLRYFVDEQGFSRKMLPLDGPGPVWIGGLCVLPRSSDDEPRNEAVAEELFCYYSRMKNLGEKLEHGLARWNDSTETFEKLVEWPLETELHPSGHPLEYAADGESWLYFPNPFPALRVRKRRSDLLDSSRYESYSCLRPGASWDDGRPALDRDPNGTLRWAWKAGTAPVTPRRWKQLLDRGLVRTDETRMRLRDRKTKKDVVAHGGTVAWNSHRDRWMMIALEVGGVSFLGEVWYSESDELMGPWIDARRIVTHDRYSFYNVRHHPYFDDEGGRTIYFEGTYSAMFSGNPLKTPRYDYNQVLYRLDLADPRLDLDDPGSRASKSPSAR